MHKNTIDMIAYFCKICALVISEWGGGGVMGVLPKKNFALNVVKLCNFRQNKHGNALSFLGKARNGMYDDLGEGTLNLEVNGIFQRFTLCIILASEASQKKS